MTTYYSTKYSLGNKGKILAIQAQHEADEGAYAVFKGLSNLQKIGRDVHRTPAEAMAAAEQARAKKIASLKRNISALERLVFTVEKDGDAS